ncbi:MAG: rRNA maturation RNase YbeY [Methanoregulaceae archaeon]|jgi:probable rRNA maturation factor|nr:rRNA maturation RNase YbeY [Methanoregulaceae archaeon]
MIHLNVQETEIHTFDQARLSHVILTTLTHEKVNDDVELTLVLGNDDQLQQLNREYLGIDAPTDVLAFPSDEVDPDSGLRYLGDIIISLTRVNEQATISGHSSNAEIELLVVHAVLHLLGYDHFDPNQKQQMWTAQTNILKELGTPLSVFPE